MRRAVLFLLLPLLLLSGCGDGRLVFGENREIEQLVPVETLGVDRSGELITVIASSASLGDRLLLKTPGVTLARAMREMQNYTEKKYIFFGHTRQLLLGEAAAREELTECLAFVERDAALRLDTRLYVVQGGTAEDAMVLPAGGGQSVGDLLESLEKDVDLLSESHVTTCAEVSEALAGRGCALVSALAAVRTENVLSAEEGEAVILLSTGYALVTPEGLCRFLDLNLSRGVNLLTGEVGGDVIEAPDGEGHWFAAQLTGAETKFRPGYEEGELTVLDIELKLSCTLSELPHTTDLSDPSVICTLETAIAALEQARITAVLDLSQALGLDFCDLGTRVRRASSLRFDAMETPWEELFPGLEISSSVSVNLERSYDGTVSTVDVREVR